MIASALPAQAKAKPSNGTPPTAPCSITQVTSRAGLPRSARAGTLAEMPKPGWRQQRPAPARHAAR